MRDQNFALCMSPVSASALCIAKQVSMLSGVCDVLQDWRYLRSMSRYSGATQFSMIVCARWIGLLPRRSAIPCSVMSTLTECSDWSTCDTIGTIAEILPSLAVEGVVKIEMYALRVKSQEPPMPFIILVPRT